MSRLQVTHDGSSKVLCKERRRDHTRELTFTGTGFHLAPDFESAVGPPWAFLLFAGAAVATGTAVVSLDAAGASAVVV